MRALDAIVLAIAGAGCGSFEARDEGGTDAGPDAVVPDARDGGTVDGGASRCASASSARLCDDFERASVRGGPWDDIRFGADVVRIDADCGHSGACLHVVPPVGTNGTYRLYEELEPSRRLTASFVARFEQTLDASNPSNPDYLMFFVVHTSSGASVYFYLREEGVGLAEQKGGEVRRQLVAPPRLGTFERYAFDLDLDRSPPSVTARVGDGASVTFPLELARDAIDDVAIGAAYAYMIRSATDARFDDVLVELP